MVHVCALLEWRESSWLKNKSSGSYAKRGKWIRGAACGGPEASGTTTNNQKQARQPTNKSRLEESQSHDVSPFQFPFLKFRVLQ
jgi:hypothetical protein